MYFVTNHFVAKFNARTFSKYIRKIWQLKRIYEISTLLCVIVKSEIGMTTEFVFSLCFYG